ncbi:MAG TPA: 23S rRNA (pseudouridine(1915)-N(3))-methyltransferase RlmH [Gammaproteobacteria bacterium]|jgi:23S rRNA (pseudouridine1915-N3)-methyltransferase|nr:23S rRNA (pseudouridine(1915)-N(3))-methyltransferase RlmH [Gammaproteobacteria bacterium]HIK72640.1 23S rRNA (pseudouridine(1915)-N(3))-methyltransferase RlmH [Gammaproteobacteria bacterium]
MNINFLTIESSRPSWAKEAFEDYSSRFNKSIKVNWNGLKPLKRTSNYNKDKTIFQESELLLSAVKERSYLVCLDKSGKSLDTLQLKSRFEGWLTATNNLTFLIGGPDGLSQNCLDKSNENWSLSPLTFPHAIVPVMIIEQIYRVWSMTQNHPYHR